MTRYHFASTLRPLESKLKSLTLFGITSALPTNVDSRAILSVAKPGTGDQGEPTDDVWSAVREVIFSQPGVGKDRYLLEDLIHNNSPSILRACLRNLLKEDVHLIK